MERLTTYMAEPTKKVTTRKEHKNEETTGDNKQKKTWWVQIRMFPIWLRIILVAALIILAAALGAMVGYGIVGDGEPRDALKLETWQHILDIMSGKK